MEKVFVVPGNGGTAQMLGVSNVNSVREDDFEGLVKLARELGVGLCVPGPDTVVVGGIEEVFRAGTFTKWFKLFERLEKIVDGVGW